VVLVNGGTASAAEVVAAALQDRGRAVLVGGRTFGKGTVQEPSRLLNGSGLELTVGHYVTPAGTSLDGVGIEPDIEVTTGAASGVAESRAIQVLHGLLADSGATGRG
jgi:carboxyl-terminal processing protease